MLIAVSTGVKVFNWIATMWRGSMTFETPMLFADSIRYVIYYWWILWFDAWNYTS